MSAEIDRPASRLIDLDTYPRRTAYEYFKTFDVPVTSVTVAVDITVFRSFIARNELRFVAALSFILTKAANETPEFRHRIVDDALVEFERVLPAFTVLSTANTLNFAKGVYTNDFRHDYRTNLDRLDRAARGLDQIGGPEHQGEIFITNIPWYSFSSIQHPYRRQNASIPIFSLGKSYRDGDGEKLPLGMQSNHALIDGRHRADFLERLTGYLARPEFMTA